MKWICRNCNQPCLLDDGRDKVISTPYSCAWSDSTVQWELHEDENES